jgi:glycosyltransferase involved in cell wall biosynthesis
VTLSVAIITKNEEANIRRTLESVRWADELIVVDSGSTDRTCDIARELGAKVFIEDWKGFAAQKNSAIEKCTGDWILSLDADEEVDETLQYLLRSSHQVGGYEDLHKGQVLSPEQETLAEAQKFVQDWRSTEPDRFPQGYFIPRKNLFLGRWIRHGGFYPDPKVRLFRRGKANFELRPVHETLTVDGKVATLEAPLIHHAYPTLSSYIEHMNSYSSLGAEMAVAKGQGRFSVLNIVIRPLATFVYNYFFRLGFLDGREGLLLHLYHSVYVSWKYAKAWERGRRLED